MISTTQQVGQLEVMDGGRRDDEAMQVKRPMSTHLKLVKSEHETAMAAQPSRDDTQLMDCISKGEQVCLEELHERYHALVFSMAKTILRNDAMSEEVVQDIFLAVWQHPEKWNPAKGRFTSWLLTITRYTAIDRLRHETRRPTVLDSPLDDVSHLFSRGHKSDEMLKDNVALVRQLLKSLPDEQQQVIYLAFFQGMTQAQIAEHLDLPLGTIKSRVRLGMRKLRDGWQQAHDEVRDGLASHEE